MDSTGVPKPDLSRIGDFGRTDVRGSAQTPRAARERLALGYNLHAALKAALKAAALRLNLSPQRPLSCRRRQGASSGGRYCRRAADS